MDTNNELSNHLAKELQINTYISGGTYITKDSGKRQTFSTGMQRDVSENKPRYDLIYLPMLTRWAELMSRGAIKYGARNWEKAGTKEEFERFQESAFRHFVKWLSGNQDEDHAAAVFFNISGAEMVRAKLSEVYEDHEP